MSLPEPIGRQREVLYYPDTGHTVVLGTAGSGKTTLAILRARWLAGHAPTKGPTLLVTFNTMLATYLRTVDPDVVREVDVLHYHKFARGYLAARGRLPGYSRIVDGRVRTELIGQAIEAVRMRYPTARILQHSPETISEETAWIARMGISTGDEYAEAERAGRGGFRVAGQARRILWEVYEEYLTIRAAKGYLYDWEDIATAVLGEFEADQTPRMYKHVVIDEGQDFSPMMIKSLAAAVPHDGTVTFFGDMAQQIYGSRISWRDAGLVVRRGVVEFKENYRNTKQIADFALALARGPYFAGVADMVAPTAPKAEGVLPALVDCLTLEGEIEFTVAQAAQLARTRSVGLLLRDRTRQEDYIRRLKARRIEARVLDRRTPSWRSEPGVWIGTYYSGKGLEFDSVLLPHLDAATIPYAERVQAVGDVATAYAEEARLLYVAFTRARATLVMTYHGELTPLLEGIDQQLFKHEVLT
jgi:superfamily I DNA/RNA helicase